MDITNAGLIVLGMHKSGTSAVTRVLSLLGARLPGDLLPPTKDNPLGYWEPRKIVSANDRLLAHVDRPWADPKPMPADWLDRSPSALSIDEAKGLIASEFGPGGGWVLKDPRLCRLIPLWRSAIESHKIEPVCLFVFRNPVEVHRSLNARNGLDAQHVFLLWLAYLLEAEAATRGLRRAVIGYDGLIRDLPSTLGRALHRIGIMKPNWSGWEDLDPFIDPSHQHFRAPADTFLSHPDARAEAKEAYAKLLSDEPFDDENLFDRLRRNWQAAWRVISPGPAASIYVRDVPEAWIGRYRSLAKLGKTAEAIAAARNAIRLGATSPQFFHHLGSLYLNWGEPEEAEVYLRKAIALTGDMAEVHITLSRALQRLGRDSEAIEAARRAMELEPEDAQICHHLGNLLLKVGQAEEAEVLQRRSIALKDNVPGFHVALSHVLNRLQRFGEATEAARRAIELGLTSPALDRHLANLLLRANQAEESKARQRKAVSSSRA